MQTCFGFFALILFSVCVSPTQQLDPPLKIRPIVDLAPLELIARFPELKKLDFAKTQDELPRLLERVGDRVQALFRDFPNTSSLERVRLETLNYPGGAVRSMNRNFQFLLIAHSLRLQSKITPLGGETTLSPEEGEIKLEEYRNRRNGAEIDIHKLKGFFLMSKGFACIPLYFHPFYRMEAVFRYLGREAEGSKAFVIAFAQRRDVARLAGTIHSSLGPLRFWVQGIAWVDPASYQVVRMRTDLLRPLVEAGLQENTTEMQLEEIQFSQISRTLWLPREVVVTTRYMNRFTLRGTPSLSCQK
jgi:hypothetical protein